MPRSRSRAMKARRPASSFARSTPNACSKPALSQDPELAAGRALGAAEIRDDDAPHALIVGVGFENDEAVPFERAQIVAERRAVHAELFGELVDRGREHRGAARRSKGPSIARP